MTSYFISGAQDHASSITQADVEIRIFENSSFSLGYAGFPIHVDKSKTVYVEVGGVVYFMASFTNRQETNQVFLCFWPSTHSVLLVMSHKKMMFLYYTIK